MPAFPITNPAWATPVSLTLEFSTSIFTGKNGTEQRAMVTAGRQSWALPYPHVSLTERDALIAVFETAKGSYDQTLSLLFPTYDVSTLTWSITNYTGLHFDQDVLEFTESLPRQYAGTVKLKQVVRTPDTGTFPSDFPALTSGAKMQFPYKRSSGFRTVSVETEGGRYAFPTRTAALRNWSAGGSAITDAEAGALWDMFRLSGGRYRSFGFTDPDSGTRYANCRFAADSVEWRILGKNYNSLQVSIQECL